MFDEGEEIQNVCRFANHITVDLKTTDSFEL